MDYIAIHKDIKSLIEQGKTKEATDALIEYLEGRQSTFGSFYNDAIQIKARYLRANRKLSMGLVKAEDADLVINQVNEACLQLLDRIEEKINIPLTPPPTNPKNLTWLWIGAGLIATMSLLFIFKQFQPDKPAPQLPAYCPAFTEDTVFNVMILPFESLDGTTSNLHKVVEQRFNLLADQFRLPINVGLGTINDNYPQRYEEANDLANECNAQLIIWGNKVDTLLVRRYKFVGLDSTFRLKLLTPGKGTSIEGIPTATNILTRGEVTQPIESELISLLLGVGSIRNGATAGVDLLKEIDINDSLDINAFLMKEMHLAEDLLVHEKEQESVEVYDKVLEAHPNYFFARLNRGVLHWDQKEYYAALSDLTFAIQLKPQNVIAYFARGRTLFDMNQLGVAKEDIEQARLLSLKDSTNVLMINYRKDYILPLQVKINKQITAIQTEINELKGNLRNIETGKITLQNQLLQAYLKIGDQEKARALVQEMEAIDEATLSYIKDHYAATKVSGRVETAAFWLAYIPSDNEPSATTASGTTSK